MKQKLEIEVKTTELDEAIEKVNRLIKLLKEAQQMISSLLQPTASKQQIVGLDPQDIEICKLQKRIADLACKCQKEK